MRSRVSELERLDALHSLAILDSLPEDAYDDLARLAASLCGTPAAIVSLVDRDRQWFKARVGLTLEGTSRDVSFCTHAIRTPDTVMVVTDASADPRFAHNPLVSADGGVRFYAGAPLVVDDEHGGSAALGTLCVFDREPRTLTDEQRLALQILARQVVRLFDLRRETQAARRSADALRRERLVADLLIGSAPAQIMAVDGRGTITAVRGEALLDGAAFAPGRRLHDALDACPGLAEASARAHLVDAAAIFGHGNRILSLSSRRQPALDGSPAGFVAVISDVTDRERAFTRLDARNRHLEVVTADLRRRADTDGLTGLANRRRFDEVMDDQVRRPNPAPMSLLTIDVDAFKSFNDRFGHPAGDEILRAVGSVLQSAARGSDLAARIGGDEFALLLPATDAPGAQVVADRLRAAWQHTPFAHERPTLSIGIATSVDGTVPAATLAAAADASLYRRKAGRTASTRVA